MLLTLMAPALYCEPGLRRRKMRSVILHRHYVTRWKQTHIFRNNNLKVIPRSWQVAETSPQLSLLLQLWNMKIEVHNEHLIHQHHNAVILILLHVPYMYTFTTVEHTKTVENHYFDILYHNYFQNQQSYWLKEYTIMIPHVNSQIHMVIWLLVTCSSRGANGDFSGHVADHCLVMISTSAGS